MPFELLEAQFSDIDEIAEILDRAHAEDTLVPQLLPSIDLPGRIAFWGEWLRGDFYKPGMKIFKIVDQSDSGKIAAFMSVRYPAPNPKQEEEQEEEVFPEGANSELLKHFFGTMNHYKNKHFDYEKDYFVNLISTRPEYHRKGLGSRLLAHFTSDAIKVNAKTYLQATPMGYPLYLRLGWKEIEDMVMNSPKGPIIWKCMMREPTTL